MTSRFNWLLRPDQTVDNTTETFNNNALGSERGTRSGSGNTLKDGQRSDLELYPRKVQGRHIHLARASLKVDVSEVLIHWSACAFDKCSVTSPAEFGNALEGALVYGGCGGGGNEWHNSGDRSRSHRSSRNQGDSGSGGSDKFGLGLAGGTLAGAGKRLPDTEFALRCKHVKRQRDTMRFLSRLQVGTGSLAFVNGASGLGSIVATQRREQ